MKAIRDRFGWWMLLSLLIATTPAIAQDVENFDDLDLITAPANGGLEFLNEGGAPNGIEQLEAMQQLFGKLAKEVEAATVNVAVAEAQGSGVVVSRDGYILTAAHVISRPNLDATITFADGSEAKAITLGVNRRMDSGMLKIIEKGKWPFLDIGESAPVAKGQWVMAIGHPGGLTKGRGLVYRAGRVLSNETTNITSDCTLVGGDSGGPLVDLDGYVIGIHSRIGTQLTENHHVPIDTFSMEWDELTDSVVVGSTTAFLGVSFSSDRTINKIEAISKNEGAEAAGMKKDDVIIKINGAETKNRSQFRRAMKKLKPGDDATFTVQRGEEEIDFDVTLGYG